MARQTTDPEDDTPDTAESAGDGSAADAGPLPTCKNAYKVGADATAAGKLALSTMNHSDHRRAMDLHQKAQTMHETASTQSQIMDNTLAAKGHVQAANYHFGQYEVHQNLVTPSYF